MLRTIVLLCAVLGASAFGVTRHTVNENFQFTFLGADIFPWIDGRSEGPVPATKYGVMQNTLKLLLEFSQHHVELAVYGVSRQEWLYRQFQNLLDRRVRVRAVVDQKQGSFGEWTPENFTYEETYRLRKILGPRSIIPDLGPDRIPRASTIMHNKFMIFDQSTVWVGSTNLSATGVGSEYNANTSLVIHSPSLARLYYQEFIQMFRNRRFSSSKAAALNDEMLVYRDGTRVRALFSPQDDVTGRGIIPFIDQVHETLDIGMFYLTDDTIVDALARALRRGVRVRLIYDASAAGNPSSRHLALRRLGVKVRVENWGGKMHMKTAIADGKHLILGSMNWSKSGNQRNDENTLFIFDNPSLAFQVTAYYNALWATLDHVANDSPRAESLLSINSCYDGLDNDHDGYVDAEDFGCSTLSK